MTRIVPARGILGSGWIAILGPTWAIQGDHLTNLALGALPTDFHNSHNYKGL
ncbi:MAG: hypothetical protein PHX05_00030 [Acidobacteriota bacterium]|nr:hypothetical protein [Acidobacteriota bacterium]